MFVVVVSCPGRDEGSRSLSLDWSVLMRAIGALSEVVTDEEAWRMFSPFPYWRTGYEHRRHSLGGYMCRGNRTDRYTSFPLNVSPFTDKLK